MDLDNIGPAITAEEMRGLYAQQYSENLETLVNVIYNEAITFAKVESEPKFEYFPKNKCLGDNIKFLTKNRKDIISNLEKLFPGSRISYKSYTQEIRINNAGRNDKYSEELIRNGLGTLFGLTREELQNLSIVIEWS